jgi:hypothetical protein
VKLLDAIIGHTGFVGGHLTKQHAFEARFNTSNIDDALGCQFSTVVCAAAPGSMFEANRFPDLDAERIENLVSNLSRIKAQHFVLISTIAVLEDPADQVDELTDRFESNKAYGKNRRRLEAFCSDRFKSCQVLRLPALFGHGLRKNFIFDLLHPAPSMLTKALYEKVSSSVPSEMSRVLADVYEWDANLNVHKINRAALTESGQRQELEAALIEGALSAVQFTNPETTFQFYNMDRLWSDIEVTRRDGIRMIHLAMEPIRASRIHEELLGRPMPPNAAPLHHENMWTRYSDSWGRSGPYLDDSPSILATLKAFYRDEKRSG